MEGCLINRIWSSGFDRKEAAPRVVVNTVLPARKAFDIGVFLIVKVRSPEAGIVPAECARLDQSKVGPCVCTHPDDVAGVLRDAWVDEDDGETG